MSKKHSPNDCFLCHVRIDNDTLEAHNNFLKSQTESGRNMEPKCLPLPSDLAKKNTDGKIEGKISDNIPEESPKKSVGTNKNSKIDVVANINKNNLDAKTLKCDKCSYNADTYISLKLHMNTDDYKEGQLLVCNKCENVYCTLISKYVHLIQDHKFDHSAEEVDVRRMVRTIRKKIK